MSQSNDSNRLIVSHETVRSGIIRVTVGNIDCVLEKWSEDFLYSIIVHHKLSYSDHEGKWKCSRLSDIPDDDSFYFKAPTFPRDCELHYNVTLCCDCPITSKNKSIDIPLIPIGSEPQHQIGDHVQYNLAGALFVEEGVILEISDSAITIRDDYDDSIVSANHCDVLSWPITVVFVVDATNRSEAESDLILKTDDPTQIAVKEAVAECIQSIFSWDSDIAEKHMYSDYDFKFMWSWMAMNIHSFLFSPDYEYRIGCVSDSCQLNAEWLWQYDLRRALGNSEACEDADIQGNWEYLPDYVGYTCDICRVEMSWFEMAYYCEPGNDHHFCVSCLHSMIQQHTEINALITGLFQNCIQEILTFCFGNVLKFAK